MAHRVVGLLGRVALACPICVAPEGALMQDGLRAGALVLVAAAALVVTPMAVFAARLWRREREQR